MATYRNAINAKTLACEIIDIETANLNNYIIDGLYGGSANEGAVDGVTQEAVKVTNDNGNADFIKSHNEEIINKAIAKNKSKSK